MDVLVSVQKGMILAFYEGSLSIADLDLYRTLLKDSPLMRYEAAQFYRLFGLVREKYPDPATGVYEFLKVYKRYLITGFVREYRLQRTNPDGTRWVPTEETIRLALNAHCFWPLKLRGVRKARNNQ